MDTPGLNHVVITVSDLARAKAFYGELLCFPINDMPEYKIFSFTAGGISFWFVSHDSVPKGDRFSEFRVGLDHLSFTAPSEEALQAVQEGVRRPRV